MNLYAIKDNKVSFWRPFTQPNEAVAIRDFSNMINHSNDDMVKQNYADLDLYQLGTYDEHTGEIVSDVKFVAAGASVKKEV